MKKIQSNWIKAFIAGALLILFYRITENYEGSIGVLDEFLGVFTPCIIGIVIAFFLWHPTELLENFIGKVKCNFLKKLKKPIAIISIYVLIAVVIALFVDFIAPKIAENVKELAKQAPTYIEEADKLISENEFITRFGIADNINEYVMGFTKESFTLDKIRSLVSAIADSFMNGFLGIIFSIYILFEKEAIKSFFDTAGRKLFKEKKGKTIKKYAIKIIDLFYSYFSGLAIDAITVGIITAVAFSIFNVPYAMALSVLAAIGNMVPFFGPIVSAVVTFVISAFTLGPVNALWVLVFQIILGQIDSNLIQPRILSKSTGISPLLVLLAVIIFGNLFGFLGMVLGVPLMATIKMVISDYFDNGTIDASDNS